MSDNQKLKDLLTCEVCGKIYEISHGEFNNRIKRNYKHNYCCIQCCNKGKLIKVDIKCAWCNKLAKKYPLDIAKYANNFCSKSCSTKHFNANKKYGCRVSKLEFWLQKQLTIKYPKLEFHFNRKDTINSELDIYIPALKLAFEINGIFHYEPIYGPEKLKSIQNNDNRKFQACLERNIEFCIIDTSTFRYFKEEKAYKYMDLISKIIDTKLQFILTL